MSAKSFVRTITVVPVTDVETSAEWYSRALGFRPVYLKRGKEPTNYAVMQRDGLELHLLLDESPVERHWSNAGTGYVYIKATDIEEVFSEIKEKAVLLKRELHTAPWGLRGFLLSDPDGNEIRIEEENPDLT